MADYILALKEGQVRYFGESSVVLDQMRADYMGEPAHAANLPRLRRPRRQYPYQVNLRLHKRQKLPELNFGNEPTMKPNQADEFRTDVFNGRRSEITTPYSLIVVFVLAAALAALAPLDSAVCSRYGTSDRKGEWYSIEGGIVSEIYVTSGEAVISGQPLVRLDAATDRADLQIVEGRIFNTQAAVDRLKAERDGEAEILFSEYLRDAATSDERAAAAMKRKLCLTLG